MPAVLYKMNLSPPARAAMMGCEVLGVEVDFVNLNILTKENKTPEYLEKNPLHSIPVYQDGDFIIHDSHAILMYLSDVYGKTDELYPKDLKKRADVNQKLLFDTGILFPRMRDIVKSLFYKGQKEVSQDQASALEEAYSYTESFLTKSKYLAGDNLTIADLSAFSTLTSLNLLVPIDSGRYPKVTAWIRTLEQESFAVKHNEPGVEDLKEVFSKALQ